MSTATAAPPPDAPVSLAAEPPDINARRLAARPALEVVGVWGRPCPDIGLSVVLDGVKHDVRMSFPNAVFLMGALQDCLQRELIRSHASRSSGMPSVEGSTPPGQSQCPPDTSSAAC